MSSFARLYGLSGRSCPSLAFATRCGPLLSWPVLAYPADPSRACAIQCWPMLASAGQCWPIQPIRSTAINAGPRLYTQLPPNSLRRGALRPGLSSQVPSRPRQSCPAVAAQPGRLQPWSLRSSPRNASPACPRQYALARLCAVSSARLSGRATALGSWSVLAEAMLCTPADPSPVCPSNGFLVPCSPAWPVPYLAFPCNAVGSTPLRPWL